MWLWMWGGLDVIFFFSSRRRHTRCYRDWSSDVCSSDLPRGPSESTLIVPVPEVEPLIAAALGGSQRSETGLPPHITLLYPFVPGEAIDETIEVAVAELL